MKTEAPGQHPQQRPAVKWPCVGDARSRGGGTRPLHVTRVLVTAAVRAGRKRDGFVGAERSIQNEITLVFSLVTRTGAGPHL